MMELDFLIRKFKTKTKVIWEFTKDTTTSWHLTTDSDYFFQFLIVCQIKFLSFKNDTVLCA